MERNKEIQDIFEIGDDSLQGVLGYHLYVTAMYKATNKNLLRDQLPDGLIPHTHSWNRFYTKEDLMEKMESIFELYQSRINLIAMVNVFEVVLKRLIDIGDGLLVLEREAEDFRNSKVDDESLLLMSGVDQYVITYKYSICHRIVSEKYLTNIYDEYRELHDPIIKNGRIIGRWFVKEGKICYLLYEKIKNKAELYQRIREMEEFLRE
ncbi:MAG: hypothetical protein ACE5K0_05015 [Candidatus Methanofastidiosia archaeon]